MTSASETASSSGPPTRRVSRKGASLVIQRALDP
jgi:hypothetical protein